MNFIKSKKGISTIICIVLMLISIFVVAKYMGNPQHFSDTINTLDDKKTNVLELTAASTAASTVITMIPGDTATPLAEKLSDLSFYFLIVLTAIFLEKYLVTITGYIAFKYIIPVALGVLMIGIFRDNGAIKKLAAKLIAFGLIISIVIPSSVVLTNMIEETYDLSSETKVEEVQKISDEIDKNTEENNGVFSWITSKFKNSLSKITTKMENLFNEFLEAVAVLIITSCIMPILVFLFFIWLVKCLFGINIDTTALLKKGKTLHSNTKEVIISKH